MRRLFAFVVALCAVSCVSDPDDTVDPDLSGSSSGGDIEFRCYSRDSRVCG